MTTFLEELRRLDAEAIVSPWDADSDGDIVATKAPLETCSDGTEMYRAVCTSSKWRGPSDPNMKLICLLRNNARRVARLIETVEEVAYDMSCTGCQEEACNKCYLESALAELNGGGDV